MIGIACITLISEKSACLPIDGTKEEEFIQVHRLKEPGQSKGAIDCSQLLCPFQPENRSFHKFQFAYLKMDWSQ